MRTLSAPHTPHRWLVAASQVAVAALALGGFVWWRSSVMRAEDQLRSDTRMTAEAKACAEEKSKHDVETRKLEEQLWEARLVRRSGMKTRTNIALL